MSDSYNKTLEESLDELKIFGDISLLFKDNIWYCKYTTKVNNKEYMFEGTGVYLFDIIKSFLTTVDKFSIKR